MIREQIQHIAKLIKAGRDVALYAASPQASQMIHILQKDYSVSPCCIVDSDPHKQGKEFYSLPIYALPDATHRWKDLHFFCAYPFANSALIGTILEYGIPRERIINYEPVKRRESCHWLENSFFLNDDRAALCCQITREIPSVKDTGDYEGMLKDVASMRESILIDPNGAQSLCAQCGHFKSDWYYEDQRVRHISIDKGGRCNFKCQYCSVEKRELWGVGGKDFDYEQFCKHIISPEDKYLLEIASGEVTVHPQRKQLYELAIGHSTNIYTNAAILDLDIAGLLASGLCTLIVSLDAGNSKTFREIKGVDCLDKVVKNLHEYKKSAGYAAFVLKYLFMPGINDDSDNIQGFLEICKNLQISLARISFDAFSSDSLNDNTFGMIRRLYNELSKMGILVTFTFIPRRYLDIIMRGESNA